MQTRTNGFYGDFYWIVGARTRDFFARPLRLGPAVLVVLAWPIAFADDRASAMRAKRPFIASTQPM